jgi:hypothetical protein
MLYGEIVELFYPEYSVSGPKTRSTFLFTLFVHFASVLYNPIKLANDETFFSFMFNDSIIKFHKVLKFEKSICRHSRKPEAWV